jgi:hypothetical protein
VNESYFVKLREQLSSKIYIKKSLNSADAQSNILSIFELPYRGPGLVEEFGGSFFYQRRRPFILTKNRSLNFEVGGILRLFM